MGNELALQYEALPLKLAYPFLAANNLQAEAESIRASKDQFGSYTSTLKRAKIVGLLSSKGLLNSFIEKHWPNGASNNGRESKRLLRIYERWVETGGASPEAGDQDDEEGGTEFALEEHLKEYLMTNLHVLETGMTLWSSGENQESVEFVVDDDKRRVDILAKDQHDIPMVIELKVSRGHEKTIGQALYYRARVKELLKVEKVRIVVVAGQISPELRAAASEIRRFII